MKSISTIAIFSLLASATFSHAETDISPEVISKGMYRKLLNYKRIGDETDIATQKMKPLHLRTYEIPQYYQEEIDAVKQLKREALAGDAHAQCLMADYYHRGYIVLQDSEKSEEFYKKAMAQNHAAAYYGLAYNYCYRPDAFFGENTNKNENRKIALKYFRKAVELGHVGAKYEMALMYLEGKALKKNTSMAVKLLRETIEATEDSIGYSVSIISKAQNQLGTCYLRGSGVKKSAKSAAHWYKLAASQLNTEGLRNYATLLSAGDGVEQDKAAAHAYQRYADIFQEDDAGDIFYDSLKVIPYIYRIQSTRDNKKLPLIISPQYPANKMQKFSPKSHQIME